MTLKEHTLDLKDRVEQIENRLEEIEEEQEDVKRRAAAFKKNNEDEPLPRDLEDEWDDLEGEKIELKGEHAKLVEAVEEWDGSEFTVKELTFGQLQGVSDDMMEASFEVDMERQDIEGTPKQGFYQIELLRESIVSQPPGAPTSEDQYGNELPEPAEYPIPVGEWLFEKVDALNTSGDTEMGNSSLEEAMKSQN